MEETGDEEKNPWEEERAWRDPCAHKLPGIVTKWLSARHEASNQSCSTHKHASPSFCTHLGTALLWCRNITANCTFLSLATPAPDSSSSKPKLPCHKLTAWLTLFSKLNPKALHSTDALRDLYMSNLSHLDRALQSIALSCILTYKSPRLTPFEGTMHALLDDT
ncbi:hypothetical protein DFH07DRAFT_1035645 [Mycena maculata]|uniref:U3 small nucleolar RNA-associated protein 20 N-terminal domain-containing protein n=1 Tax=Mycena maculata TaxID=230809 RepID=A0AAD7N7E4_9AGAR|nr:hypothetical protein DFH07DRAFT_1035645 [Mycena maculata]